MTVDKNIQYIRSLLKEEQDTGRLRREEEQRHIPVIRPEVLRLLTLCIRLSKTEKILEIGAGEGYSAICFAKAIGENADIITIEQDEERVHAARSNIQAFGLKKAITVIHDDAAAACRSMPGEEIFDMVFLDGPKTHYLSLLDDCIRLVTTGGLIVADNVLYFGMVSGEKELLRKKRTSTEHLQEFLEAVTTDARLLTAIINFEDGLAISMKKEEKNQ